MESRAEECLEWIRNEKGINFHDRFGIVGLVLEWANKIEQKKSIKGDFPKYLFIK